MRSDLDPIKTKRLSLLGPHQLTLTGIKWVGLPTDTEYAAACAFVGVIQRVEAWLDGDLMLELVRREQEKHPALSPRAIIAQHHSPLPFDQRYERYLISSTFPLVERSASLTHSHHRVCWAHGGPTYKEQMRWLHLAQTNQWSVRELSAAIMGKKPDSPHPIPPSFPTDLQSAVDYAHSHLSEIDKLSAEQATTLANELEPVVAYYAACRARASST